MQLGQRIAIMPELAVANSRVSYGDSKVCGPRSSYADGDADADAGDADAIGIADADGKKGVVECCQIGQVQE